MHPYDFVPRYKHSEYSAPKPTNRTTRPAILKGDLVRLKNNKNGPGFFVVSIPLARLSTDGFAQIRVKDISGKLHTYKRKQLWRVPNQPKLAW